MNSMVYDTLRFKRFGNSKIKSVEHPPGFEYMCSNLKNASTMLTAVTRFLVFLFCLLSVLANIHSDVDGEDPEIPKIRRRRAESAALGKGFIKEGFETDNRAMRFFCVRREVLVADLGKGLVKGGPKVGKWAMRFFRVRRAKGIMTAGATLWKKEKDLRVDWYFKPGGKAGARKDFWMIDAYGKTVGKRNNQSYFEKGTVGDSIAEFHRQYSEKQPFPALVLYRKNSPERTRGTVIVVLYK